MLIEFLAGGVLTAATIFPTTWRPWFTGVANKVAVCFENIRVGLELLWKYTGMRSGFFQLPNISPGQKGCAGGAALRGGAKAMGKQDSRFGYAVEGGSRNCFVAIGACVGPALII